MTLYSISGFLQSGSLGTQAPRYIPNAGMPMRPGYGRNQMEVKMSRHKRKNPKARRESAETRQAERAKRTDQEQIQRLEAAGHGHGKEATRLRNKGGTK